MYQSKQTPTATIVTEKKILTSSPGTLTYDNFNLGSPFLTDTGQHSQFLQFFLYILPIYMYCNVDLCFLLNSFQTKYIFFWQNILYRKSTSEVIKSFYLRPFRNFSVLYRVSVPLLWVEIKWKRTSLRYFEVFHKVVVKVLLRGRCS